MTASRPTIFPALRYDDASSVIDWLSKTFGFEASLVVPGEKGTIRHAQLQLGNGMVMLTSRRGRFDPTSPWGQNDHGVYVHVEDVDAHYERACAAGADIVMILSETDYGSREYSVRDPEGRLWSFGTYNPLEN